MSNTLAEFLKSANSILALCRPLSFLSNTLNLSSASSQKILFIGFKVSPVALSLWFKLSKRAKTSSASPLNVCYCPNSSGLNASYILFRASIYSNLNSIGLFAITLSISFSHTFRHSTDIPMFTFVLSSYLFQTLLQFSVISILSNFTLKSGSFPLSNAIFLFAS